MNADLILQSGLHNDQLRLVSLISDISEDIAAAKWMHNIERDLYCMVFGVPGHSIAGPSVTQLDELRALALHTRSWFEWPSIEQPGPTLIALQWAEQRWAGQA
jgi:hypothetical protein